MAVAFALDKGRDLKQRWSTQAGPTIIGATRTGYHNNKSRVAGAIVAILAFIVLWRAAPTPNLSDVGRIWTSLIGKTTHRCLGSQEEAVPFPEPIARTALASFPRSGSSYTRSLVERATGYQVSSLYCDYRLLKFKAECAGLDSPFLIKTHFPFSKSADVDPSVPHWSHYARAIRIVRNPFDCIWSAYHFTHSKSHSARVQSVASLSIQRHKSFLQQSVVDWVRHARYWQEEAKIPVHTVRYEDLRLRGVATLKGLVDFLVPSSHRPSSERLQCAAMDDPSKDPYWSRKSPPFTAWHHYDEDTRRWMLDAVKHVWCEHDFNALFVESTALLPPVDCANMTVLI